MRAPERLAATDTVWHLSAVRDEGEPAVSCQPRHIVESDGYQLDDSDPLLCDCQRAKIAAAQGVIDETHAALAKAGATIHDIANHDLAIAVQRLIEERDKARRELGAAERQIHRLIHGQEIESDRICDHELALAAEIARRDDCQLARIAALEAERERLRAEVDLLAYFYQDQVLLSPYDDTEVERTPTNEEDAVERRINEAHRAKPSQERREVDRQTRRGGRGQAVKRKGKP